MEENVAVLIVDDNVSLCKSMSLVLRRKGYAVTVARNGLEAVERVRECPFEMILLDIKMPVVDGVETYRRIRKIRSDAVVMMMTAYSVDDLAREAIEEGAQGVLCKPPDMQEILTLIEKARKHETA